MEKLIQLLNEYEKSKDFRDYEWRIEKKSKERPCGTLIMGMSGEQFTGAYINDEEMERIIISKKYEFIKWLVGNNMVNLDKLKENTVFTMFTHCVGIGCEWNADSESVLKAIGTDALIAYTSIQDKPIDFLISILK